MAGTIPLSMSQQLDIYGNPLAGGLLYIYQAGTVATPQNPYQDTGLTLVLPNPITLDQAGRIPQFFLADGYIKIRLTDVNGVTQIVADNILVIGPSAGGGGGGGGVDPTTILQTGDVKIRYDTAILAGFVRLNGKTIGSASSGATELADPSANALFNFLWLKDSTLTVTPGGRGASGAADWAANKQIALPDGRNRLLMALGDMGSSDAGLLAGVTFGKGNGTTLGSFCGITRKTLALTEIPSHQHNVYLKENPHAHSYSAVRAGGAALAGGQAPSVPVNSDTGGTTGTASTGITVGSVNGVANDNLTTAQGGGATFDLANPMLFITVYMKL